jgi:hypothetical protein
VRCATPTSGRPSCPQLCPGWSGPSRRPRAGPARPRPAANSCLCRTRHRPPDAGERGNAGHPGSGGPPSAAGAGVLNPAWPALAPKARCEHGREGSGGRARGRGEAGHRAEATPPAQAGEADRPGPVAGRPGADLAHLPVEPGPTWPRDHSGSSSKRTRAVYTIHASNPSRRKICASAPLYWVQYPRLRRNAVPGRSQACNTEYVVNLSCTSREAWSIRSHPAAPGRLARGHSTGQAALPHASIVPRLPGPMTAPSSAAPDRPHPRIAT